MTPGDYRKELQSKLRSRVTSHGKALQIFRDSKKSDTRRAKALASAGVVEAQSDLTQLHKLALNDKVGEDLRVAAIFQLTPVIQSDRACLDQLLELLADTGQSAAVRGAVLGLLKGAQFVIPDMGKSRPRYLSILRTLARSEDESIRIRVLGMLVREGDGPTFRILEKGLLNPDKAAVAPAKALQLLRYDNKRKLQAVLQQLAETGESDEVRCQALTSLSADKSAKSLFEKLAGRKKESPRARAIALVALQANDAIAFQKVAKKLLRDDSEDEALREVCLTAAATLNVEDGVNLAREAEALAAAGSRRLKVAAKGYLRKATREEK